MSYKYKSMALPNRIFYWSGNQYNKDDQAAECRIEQIFNEAVIKDPSKWHVAVERCELSLNGIPFFDGGLNQIQIVPTNGNPPSIFLALPLSFSLTELLEQLTQAMADLSGTYADAAGLTFRADKHGYINIDWALFITHEIHFSEKLAETLGFPQILRTLPVVRRISPTPRFDLGDQLNHIVLKTSLPVVSDRIGQVFTKVIADFSILEAFGSDVSLAVDNSQIGQGYSFSPRQQMNYVPTEKRFVNLDSNAPIDRIEVQAYYTDHRNASRRVFLPKGAGFSIKIGFYSKR